jgi:hypothetical protein
MLLSLADMVQSAEGAPTKQEGEIYRDIAAKVEHNLGMLRALHTGDLAAFNRLLKELDVPGVTVNTPVVIP